MLSLRLFRSRLHWYRDWTRGLLHSTKLSIRMIQYDRDFRREQQRKRFAPSSKNYAKPCKPSSVPRM